MSIQDETDAKLRESDATFARDLPALLREYGGGWVAYHEKERIGVAATKMDIYEHCFGLGLERGKFLVRSIEAPEVALTIGHMQMTSFD